MIKVIKGLYGLNSYVNNGVVTLIDGEVERPLTAQEETEVGVAMAQNAAMTQLAAMSDAIQNLLDSQAQVYRYDNMMSVRSYTGYANPFQTESLNLADWASNCWATAGQIEYDVMNGLRPIPSIEGLLAEMPVFVPLP